MNEGIGALELLLRRDGVVVGGSLLAMTVISWLYLVLLTARMAGGDTGAKPTLSPERRQGSRRAIRPHTVKSR